MSYEEKGAWIMAVVTPVTYAIYLTLVLGRAEGTPLTEVPYVSTMLWTIGAAIAASIVLLIVVAMASPKDADKKDQRTGRSTGSANTSANRSSSSVAWRHSSCRWLS
jgi:hypothetical protein